MKVFPLRQAATAAATQLGQLLEASVGAVGGFWGLFAGNPDPHDDPLAAFYGTNLVKDLKKAGLNNRDIAWSQLLPTAAAFVPNMAEVVRSSPVSLICLIITHAPFPNYCFSPL